MNAFAVGHAAMRGTALGVDMSHDISFWHESARKHPNMQVLKNRVKECLTSLVGDGLSARNLFLAA
jgi:hypothetical protein